MRLIGVTAVSDPFGGRDERACPGLDHAHHRGQDHGQRVPDPPRGSRTSASAVCRRGASTTGSGSSTPPT